MKTPDKPAHVPVQRSVWQQAVYRPLGWVIAMLPGLGIATALAWVGILGSDWIGGQLLGVTGKSPVSPILLAVIGGLLIRNLFHLPPVFDRGLKLCTTTVLRLGIVLLGLGLSILAVGEIGLRGVPIIAGCILTALLAVTWINRALDLPRRLGTLIAVGTSICGVSAIVATAPAIDADDDETSYAVACITIFGLVALFTYPFLAHFIFDGDQQQAGLFLGTAIHDTAQVAGAATMYRDQYAADAAMKVAVTVKLVRNLSMSLLIPLLALLYHRQARQPTNPENSGGGGGQRWYEVVPLFVIGFAAMACLRSLGDRWAQEFIALRTWETLISGAGQAAGWCLAIAMAGVGLRTDLARLRGLGWKPFTVGCAAAVLVGVASVALIMLLG